MLYAVLATSSFFLSLEVLSLYGDRIRQSLFREFRESSLLCFSSTRRKKEKN